MAALSFSQPPASLCILRLSAIGDVTHLLPVVATLQQQWPETRITWIIGSVEYQLVKSLPGIEFIVFNKDNGLKEYLALRKKLARRDFDILLMMQVALRANLISLLLKANFKIGYDRQRARDFHGFFCNQHIEGPVRVHVLDTFFQFIEKLGIRERTMDWLLKADEPSRKFAQEIIGQQPAVVINPCSSLRPNNWRNWSESSYAAVIDNLMGKGFRVIISGGPSAQEKLFTERVLERCQQQPIDMVGKTSLMQLLALLEQARCLIAPDTGPAHMGTVAGIPVIGLYASSNPLRSGPYNSQSVRVNAFPEALQKFSHKTPEQARWGERIRHPQVMSLITVKAVIEKVEQILDHTD
jgi:heptosyltransferase I